MKVTSGKDDAPKSSCWAGCMKKGLVNDRFDLARLFGGIRERT